MVFLRATQKVLKSLPPKTDFDGPSDTALGDWYVNRFVVDRQPLLLLVSSESLLGIVVPARDVRSLPHRLHELVASRLHCFGVPHPVCQAEVEAMLPVHVAPTRDRSVLGTMNDFVQTIPYHLPLDGWDHQDLRGLEVNLADTPCRCSKRDSDVIWPGRKARELLLEKWG